MAVRAAIDISNHDAQRGRSEHGSTDIVLTPGQVIIDARIVDTTISRADIEKALAESDLYRVTNRNLERMAAGVYRDPSQFISDVRETAIAGAIGDDRMVVGEHKELCGRCRSWVNAVWVSDDYRRGPHF